MKKILTVLLAVAMVATTSTGIFAEELSPNEVEVKTGETLADLTGSIDLEAIMVSSYTVKLPKKLDVKEKKVTCDIKAKGDVDAAKKIVIEESNAGQNKLVDQAGDKTAVDLSVSFGNGIEGKDIKADYDTAKETMTIEHGDLAAATWKCQLPIVIKLADASLAG